MAKGAVRTALKGEIFQALAASREEAREISRCLPREAASGELLKRDFKIKQAGVDEAANHQRQARSTQSRARGLDLAQTR